MTYSCDILEHGQLVWSRPRPAKYLFVQFDLIHVSILTLLIICPIVATAYQLTVFVNVNFVAGLFVCRFSEGLSDGIRD